MLLNDISLEPGSVLLFKVSSLTLVLI